MKRLEEICIFIRNGLNIKNNKSKKGIPITRIETISNGIIDINKTGYADIFNEKYSDYYLQKDDILMSHINSLKHLGKVGYCYYDMKIIHGMNLLNIRVNPNNVYPKYLYYYFKSNNFKIKLNKISKQSVNQSSFSISDLKKIRIDIIDLKKQKLIASKLDKVVEVISIRKKQIEELNNLIKSQFVEMFETIKRYVELQKVCLFINGDRGENYPSGDKISKNKEGVAFINAGLLESNKVNWSNMNYISEDTYNNLRSGKIQKDDILYCLRGSLGKCAIIDFSERGAIASSLVILRANKNEINPNFLLIQLGMEEILYQQNQANNGSSQPNLSANSVKKYKILLPPITLQNQFSEIVKQIDKQKFESMIQLEMMEKIYNIINDRRRYV